MADGPQRLKAPWSPEQVARLNQAQKYGRIHPFTCPRHGDPRDLVATENGWECPRPDCDYTQDWAYEVEPWMLVDLLGSIRQNL